MPRCRDFKDGAVANSDRGAVHFFDISTVTENTDPAFPANENQRLTAGAPVDSEFFGQSVAVDWNFFTGPPAPAPTVVATGDQSKSLSLLMVPLVTNLASVLAFLGTP